MQYALSFSNNVERQFRLKVPNANVSAYLVLQAKRRRKSNASSIGLVSQKFYSRTSKKFCYMVGQSNKGPVQSV